MSPSARSARLPGTPAAETDSTSAFRLQRLAFLTPSPAHPLMKIILLPLAATSLLALTTDPPISGLSNLTATAILGWYAWQTATRTVPQLVADFRAEASSPKSNPPSPSSANTARPPPPASNNSSPLLPPCPLPTAHCPPFTAIPPAPSSTPAPTSITTSPLPASTPPTSSPSCRPSSAPSPRAW